MFLHVFTNRFKCLLRDRQLIFWTLLYPLVLGTFFSLAFSNIGGSDAFTSIPIAVVNNAGYQTDLAFRARWIPYLSAAKKRSRCLPWHWHQSRKRISSWKKVR